LNQKKKLGFFIIGLLLFLPSIKISPAQESYVGVQEGDKYLWRFGLHKINWGGYFSDQLEIILDNLWPLGDFALIGAYTEWYWIPVEPPQTYWPFNITAMGPELTSSILSPFDNTTITSMPVYAEAGWQLSYAPDYNSYYNGTWYIVNDTSSFLRQTLNLTLAFSPYGIMSVPLAPKTINWTLFVTEFLEVMNSRGGLYKNTSATAKSNGYSLNVPPWGYENNSAAIDINVKYDSKGLLTEYEFLYGGKLLVNYWLGRSDTIALGDMLTIIFGAGFIIVIALVVFIMRWVLKHNN
jgi:hypothetical protein